MVETDSQTGGGFTGEVIPARPDWPNAAGNGSCQKDWTRLVVRHESIEEQAVGRASSQIDRVGGRELEHSPARTRFLRGANRDRHHGVGSLRRCTGPARQVGARALRGRLCYRSWMRKSLPTIALLAACTGSGYGPELPPIGVDDVAHVDHHVRTGDASAPASLVCDSVAAREAKSVVAVAPGQHGRVLGVDESGTRFMLATTEGVFSHEAGGTTRELFSSASRLLAAQPAEDRALFITDAGDLWAFVEGTLSNLGSHPDDSGAYPLADWTFVVVATATSVRVYELKEGTEVLAADPVDAVG